jgi:hypothetical protein
VELDRDRGVDIRSPTDSASNPPSMPCTLPNGQLMDAIGNSASFTFTSTGGSTQCTFYDLEWEPASVNVTIVSPVA